MRNVKTLNSKVYLKIYTLTFKESKTARDFYNGYMEAFCTWIAEKDYTSATRKSWARGNAHFYAFKSFCDIWKLKITRCFVDDIDYSKIHICSLKKGSYVSSDIKN